MTRCTDYDRHELYCLHPDEPQLRWKTEDGCCASCCERCAEAVREWPDLLSLVRVTPLGLPIDPADDGPGDRLIRSAIAESLGRAQ